MVLGNGSRTLVWHHRWATTDPIISCAIKEMPLKLQDVIVKEIWVNSSGWHLDIFS